MATAARPPSGKTPSVITPKAIALAVKAQGINTPYWSRVVGNRLEIQPLGGQVIEIPFGPHDRPEPLIAAADFRRMKRDELRALAKTLDIEGSASMLKDQLVDAIMEA